MVIVPRPGTMSSQVSTGMRERVSLLCNIGKVGLRVPILYPFKSFNQTGLLLGSYFYFQRYLVIPIPGLSAFQWSYCTFVCYSYVPDPLFYGANLYLFIGGVGVNIIRQSLIIQPKLALSFWFSCLNLLSSGIIGMFSYTALMCFLTQNLISVVSSCLVSCPLTL
jgi:hypothetical protein